MKSQISVFTHTGCQKRFAARNVSFSSSSASRSPQESSVALPPNRQVAMREIQTVVKIERLHVCNCNISIYISNLKENEDGKL